MEDSESDTGFRTVFRGYRRGYARGHGRGRGHSSGECVYSEIDPEPPQLPRKSMTESPATKHLPKYKDFLFDGTITLYVGPESKKMEMHKKLLASISPELNKHVNNDMREGIEGIIRLPDEGEETLTLFTEWAYTGNYTHEGDTQSTFPEPSQDPWSSLHKHLQLCVFSDKFNIEALKQLAELKFHTEINPLEPQGERDAAGLLMVIGYAYDNLPSWDPVLTFLAQYASWKLELLRTTIGFDNLILAQPDFLNRLLIYLNGLKTKPTIPQKHRTPHSNLFSLESTKW